MVFWPARFLGGVSWAVEWVEGEGGVVHCEPDGVVELFREGVGA
jgi:hypothetical protein